uniref:Uncharacterized protein n=1 Tax=Nothoprocta perdicaria TaxID=30464 RepID=A0A8C6ZXB2_NOTPE
MAPVLAEKKLLGPEGPGGAELPSEEEEGQNLWDTSWASLKSYVYMKDLNRESES